MAPRPEAVEEWFQLVPELMSPEGWDLALARPQAQLSHRTCPWGGHLIKFAFKGITLQNPPSKSSNIFVRPEVRAEFQHESPATGLTITDCDLQRPGEAILKGSNSWKFMQLCSVLFAQSGVASQCMNYFFHVGEPTRVHHKIRRDYPEVGDSALTIYEQDGAQSCLFLVRPEEENDMNFVAVVHVAEDKFATWATFQFRWLLESARKTVCWLLNRPGIEKLRSIDGNFYTVLRIQSLKRGYPFVPSNEPDVAIDAGDRVGLKLWARYKPGLFGNKKFRLCDYLRVFLSTIGEEVETYDSLDGRELVPYQCVVRRSAWEMVKPRFLDVFPLAKTAYRRANGGSSAPVIQEHVEPKYLAEGLQMKEESQAEPRLIVRNTFVDVEDDVELARQAEVQMRDSRRPKTIQGLPAYVACT